MKYCIQVLNGHSIESIRQIQPQLCAMYTALTDYLTTINEQFQTYTKVAAKDKLVPVPSIVTVLFHKLHIVHVHIIKSC